MMIGLPTRSKAFHTVANCHSVRMHYSQGFPDLPHPISPKEFHLLHFVISQDALPVSFSRLPRVNLYPHSSRIVKRTLVLF
jgi:hypothetical protein